MIIMNKYITYTARAKINNLIKNVPERTAIKISFENGRLQLDYVYDNRNKNDIIICTNPLTVTNLRTLKVLNSGSIDFNYSCGEFLITRSLNELSTYT